MTAPVVLPRLKPLSARKSAILSVLDVGTSKIVCLVAQLQPWEGAEGLTNRTHLARILGIGHHRSVGLKGGAIVDLEAVEASIRHAVHAAERMAKVEIQSVIVNLTGGRIASQRLSSTVTARGTVGEAEIQRTLRLATAGGVGQGRITLHSIPLSYTLDAQAGIADPTGMLGEKLSVDLHVVGAQGAAARNLMLAVERCHLDVEAVVATPYAAGLSALSDDEAEMGVVVVDCGGGTTSVGVFEAGHLVHADALAVGGHHVTMDVARGLATKLSAAERLKTLHGACIASAADERDLIHVPTVDEDERDVAAHLPKSHLVRIVRPRVEEILELVRDRLAEAGHGPRPGRRIVLTGGASQLAGLPETARRILEGPVRIGRPLGIKGLPEAAKGPAFTAAVGLLVYPQVSHAERFDARGGQAGGAEGQGYISRVGRWLRESF
ncbi:cell division protein FtsA [Salinarimonas ramus]|uniref:Cell division protein FtsA n=1 Tax=Salinarimonas ramus TaxID=690164 RepID=A0A917Q617_9HYPH|nr:cell division protein FtsA [Salinarimonas ramus]GGK30078.1 cell division protein FtsA [Salinarimonas ramus]